MAIFTSDGKLLAVPGEGLATNSACCCTGTTGLQCAGGTEPSVVLTITAPDVDLPISWCGKTWVASTETPGADEAYSGVPQEVCPTDYYKRNYVTTYGIDAAEVWQNRPTTFATSNLDLLRAYKVIQFTPPAGSWFGSSQGWMNNIVLFGDGDKMYFNGTGPVQPISPAGNIFSPSDLGILTAGMFATKSDYRILNAQFGSYTRGNVTYAWAKGTNW